LITVLPLFEETVEVTYLAVHADYRNRGLGSELLRAARDDARDQGAWCLALLTLGPSAASSAYEETVLFYRSRGFWRVKEMPLTAWNGAPALLMLATLDAIR
jgi:ribosomal protein S18 acetylase RimI-like enzyme